MARTGSPVAFGAGADLNGVLPHLTRDYIHTPLFHIEARSRALYRDTTHARVTAPLGQLWGRLWCERTLHHGA